MRIKAKFLLIFLFAGCYSSAQKSAFDLGINLGYGTAYRTLKAIDHSALAENLISSRNANETVLLPLQLGLSFGWTPCDNWRISTGLRWATRGYQYRAMTSLSDVNGTLYLADAQIKYKSQWLEIPLDVQWQFYSINDKWKLKAEAGVFYGMKLSARSITHLSYDNQEFNSNTDDELIVRHFYGAHLAAGFNRQFSSRFNLDLLLDFQHGLSRMNTDNVAGAISPAIIHGYFNALQIKAGVHYRL